MTAEKNFKLFNPLTRENLATSVGEALLGLDPIRLEDTGDALGAGVYAIYYVGDFSSYAPIKMANIASKWSAPIYVGKAIPKGGRKGNFSSPKKPGKELAKRLREHADSIAAVENLELDDFYCRYLAVDDIWIPLGENLLISRYSPIWNTTVDGFGNHTPGAGRFNQKRSRWDVLHPGRDWAMKCAERPETKAQIEREVTHHLNERTFEY